MKADHPSSKRNSNSHYQLETSPQDEEEKHGDPMKNPFLPAGGSSSEGASADGEGVGEISNIEKLYKKVVSEFSNFSKNFTEKPPKPKTGLQDFLSMFDQEKQDPSQHGDDRDDDAIIVSDYLLYEKGDIVKTEGYYVTKAAQVKGILIFSKDYLKFEPVKCSENEALKDGVTSFSAVLDYNDIGSTDMIKLINEKALLQDSDHIKEAYMYDYLIQVNLTAVNGLSYIGPSDGSQYKKAIANVFFKFSYLDMDGMMLTTDNQRKIVEEINMKFQEYIANCKKGDESCTFAPYFDITLNEQQKGNLGEVAVSSIIKDRVMNEHLKGTLKPPAQVKSATHQQAQLIKYVPNKSEKSEILNDFQISCLIEQLPSMLTMCDWELIYSINRDGISMLTFFEKCKRCSDTILVVQDFQGATFGGYCSEPWRVSSNFYGSGENLLFTFKHGPKPKVYRWSGVDDQFQWANSTSLGMGGGSRGRFGLFIKDSLYKGSSSNTSTFDNEILSTEGDFIISLLEVWALK